MEASSSTDLPESIFFTARKARNRSNTEDAASSSSPPAPSSREYYSARIKSIMERKSESCMSREDADIEASKDHWTVEGDYFTAATRMDSSDLTTSEGESVSEPLLTESERLSLYEENLKEMLRLKGANPESGFFQIGDNGLVLGKKIGEGGQAEIYDAGIANFQEDFATYPMDGRHTSDAHDERGDWLFDYHSYAVVLKVFKAGFPVSALQSQWPLAFLHKSAGVNHPEENDGCNPIIFGRLLDDGRFAFQMRRLMGDLRKWLDTRMEYNGNRRPPFMMPDGNYYECCMIRIIYNIAEGMRNLHAGGILHRDLKASNVLLDSLSYSYTEKQFKVTGSNHDMKCFVSDYECSIGVVGTGYWRAPEILEALKHRRVYTTPNLFTPKSDVYSFAMTCYEVFTGLMPFEEVEDCNERRLRDDVLEGRRPTLPSHLQPWVVDLMNKCWHMDPCERPTFEEIFSLLFGKVDLWDRSTESSVFYSKHDN